jgi:glycosyltransferase involved in cell wall biosynthesis
MRRQYHPSFPFDRLPTASCCLPRRPGAIRFVSPLPATTEPLRVLHVGKFYPPAHGGMEVFLADLIAAQRAQGIDAAAIVHGQPLPDDPAWLVRVPVQAQWIYAPIALGFRKALAQAIERFRPDVLHLHMPNNAVFWALTLPAAGRVPWVVHWHSDVVVEQSQAALRIAYRLYRPFEQAVLERAERIVATSPPYLQASEALRRWRDKCAVVPLGLRVDAEAASDRPAPSQPLKLLAIGRLAHYKGFDTLIRAVAPMTDVELRIAGDGEMRGELEALIRGLTPAGAAPSARLLGRVDDDAKEDLLQQCDVVCVPSCERTEAFGVVLLEAMKHARPCIASDLRGSGMPWLVREAGVGLLAPAHDVEGWRQAIAHLRDDPALRQRLGQAGRAALMDRFSIDVCARQTAAVYALCFQPDQRSTAQKKELIVIPARDEASTIGALIGQLQASGWRDVLVVDDQSSDGTGDAAREAGAIVMRPVLPVGAWGATQAGIRLALARGFGAVITMDADGQHEVAEIPALLARRHDADIVIGAHPERASRLRHVAWWWFRRLTGFELRDLTSGFRYYSRVAMELMASREATLLDYQDLGALLLMSRAGLRIAEVPVSMSPRTVGHSRVFRSWFSVARYMAVTTLLCLSRWDVPSRRAAR